MKYPLQNLRVINFGWVWAAPALGQVLGDMGAEVIKVESHKRPDIVRVIPPLAQDKPLESLYAHCTMRDHLGITLDLTNPKGQGLARELVKTADVVIENFSPRVMPRFGLDYPKVKSLRPDIIMISLSAAGQTGPDSQITTYGNIIACLAGIDFHQGYVEEAPSSCGTAIADPLIGVLGAFSVLAALRYRSRTGKGQYIDLSQWEAVAATVGGPMMDYIFNGRTQHSLGNRDTMMAPHGVYRCKGEDSWVTIAVKTDDQWQKLCEVVDNHELAVDPRFSDVHHRQRNHDDLDKIISQWTQNMDQWRVTDVLQRIGIAAFPALSSKEVFTDKHFNARGDFVKVNHPLGEEVIYDVPWKLTKTPGGVHRPAPSVGQDNQQIYAGLLGISPPELTQLEEDRIVY